MSCLWRGLTGATSRGNGGRYTYYYCSVDSKHLLIRAEIANELFARFISGLKPNPTILHIYEHVLLDVHNDAKREVKSEIKSIKSQIAAKRKQIEQVEDMMITDRTNAERYSRILKRYENEVCELDFRVEMMQTPNETLLKPKLHYAILLINNAVMYIRDAPVEVKIKLIGSMFPEKLSFDGKSYRTKKMNRVLDAIYQQTKELRGHKKKNETNEKSFVSLGTPSGARTLDPNIKSVVLYQLS